MEQLMRYGWIEFPLNEDSFHWKAERLKIFENGFLDNSENTSCCQISHTKQYLIISVERFRWSFTMGNPCQDYIPQVHVRKMTTDASCFWRSSANFFHRVVAKRAYFQLQRRNFPGNPFLGINPFQKIRIFIKS